MTSRQQPWNPFGDLHITEYICAKAGTTLAEYGERQNDVFYTKITNKQTETGRT